MNDVPITEDADESLGTLYKGKYTGTFGDYGIFSFKGIKLSLHPEGGFSKYDFICEGVSEKLFENGVCLPSEVPFCDTKKGMILDLKDLIIIGAGGFGRELLSYAIDIMQSNDCKWRVKGFIDDNLDALKDINTGYPILGTISEHKIDANAVYICAIGDGKTRLLIGRDFLKKNAMFINFIHTTAKIRERVKMGTGNIFCPNTSVNPDVTIGDFVLLNSNASLAHDCVVGDGCSFLGGNSVNGSCILGDCVFMGANSIIIPGRKIGENAKISAGAVIFTHVRQGKTMIGNPARVLK